MHRETVTLTQTEQRRVHVLARVQHGILGAKEAAALLGFSLRHLRRLLARWRQQGLAALAHGNRGRPSPRRVSDTIRTRVLTLARTRYAGANDHHLTELLREREGLRLSRQTVQRLLRAAGIGSPRTRRPPRHRRRRERIPQAGLLIQMDGSQHPWLEDRGPRLVLLAAIDDATGRVLAAVFRREEDAQGYFLLLRQLIRRYGLPCAAYTDRHGIFHRDPRTPMSVAEQLADRPESTQVGRALQELGIRWIPARSPQAKGRIERLFGTFQDRLVVELRLAHASTLAQAQRVGGDRINELRQQLVLTHVRSRSHGPHSHNHSPVKGKFPSAWPSKVIVGTVMGAGRRAVFRCRRTARIRVRGRVGVGKNG